MQHNILVIDDDPAVLATVADILRDEGYCVRTAASGRDGLAAAEQQRPSLILLDMRMPGMDGWSVAQALRARGLDVPLVVMTAAQDSRGWAQEVGAAHSLPKPFDLLELLGAVAQFVPLQ